MTQKQIRLRNVRVNNLKSISLDIPHGQWLSICGLSGSGKSSLAFDTLYAEGQRRYLECLSPATRRYLVKLDKPDADLIDGLPPAIGVRRARGIADRKSTVGNASEVVELLRVVFANVANIVCPVCQSNVNVAHTGSIVQRLDEQASGTRYLIAFETRIDDFNSVYDLLNVARKNGFTRAIVGSQMVSLDSVTKGTWDEAKQGPTFSNLFNSHSQSKLAIVVDRLAVGSVDHSRVRESLETALQFGNGQCQICVANDGAVERETNERKSFVEIDGRRFSQFTFSTRPICPTCQRIFPKPEPRLFNFNQVTYACSECDGVGFVDSHFRRQCPVCNGDRLSSDALAFKVGGKPISELCRVPIARLSGFIESLNLSCDSEIVVRPLIKQILARLNYLQSVGLGYLTLDRPLQTVSTGEAQRLQLTSCLSSTLVNMLYVLDEPSCGLHANDLPKLVAAIADLNRRPNTIVVVDHHPGVIAAAERIVEIGPGAGDAGGDVVFDGTIDKLSLAETATGHFLAGKRGLAFEPNLRQSRGKQLQLFGASGNNLKGIDISFPLGCLCVVTGVSGAGKSTLVRQTLYPALQQKLEQTSDLNFLPFKGLLGVEDLDEVVLIDPTPIGRSGRSNPVIYVKAFDEIRQAFADTADAKLKQATPGHFSFNVPGGRCEKCEGDGYLQFDMQFLADVFVKCDECSGTRYRESTLQIKYRGLNIAEVLTMTAREAFSFFRGQPRVQAKLKALIDVGLDYIRLGQPANFLSGGESQRLKLALFLNASKQKRTLFIIEEPTVGLHPADVTRLLDGFDSLIGVGHSFIIVEHDLQVIKNADWIIDIGPGAADAGGEVVAFGTPQQVAANPNSVTGRYLVDP